MNNLEIECLDFIGELFTNRPKDINGNDITYKYDDNVLILNARNQMKNRFVENKDNLNNNSFRLLLQLYDIILELLNNKII